MTDGSPQRELATAIAVLLACFLTAQLPGVVRRLDPLLAGLASWLRRRGIFAAHSVRVEQRRLDILRIVLGVMVTCRTVGNFGSALAGGDPLTIQMTGVAFALALALLLGLATPVVGIITMLLTSLVFDIRTGTGTLSSAVLAMNLMVFTFAPAGRSLSIDAVLLRRTDLVGRVWGRLYGAVGPLTLDRSVVAKFCLLVAYASINLSSSLMHFATETWLSGFAISWVLADPTMAPSVYPISHWLYERSPSAYVGLTSAMTYGILVFQFGLLPLVLFGRWTRFIGTFLEFGFVAGSTFMLNLQMLGTYQIVSLALLFWSRWRLNDAGRDAVHVLYDHRHRPSRRVVAAVRALDVFDVVDARPLSADSDAGRMAAWGTAEGGGRQLRLVGIGADRRGRSGYDALVLLAGRVFLLLPFWPILAAVRAIRRLVAAQRSHRSEPAASVARAWAGSVKDDATLARDDASDGATTARPARPLGPAGPGIGLTGMTPAFRAFFLAFAILFLAFVPRMLQPTGAPGIALTPPPFHPSNSVTLVRLAELSRATFGQSTLLFGMTPVNAFNFPPRSGEGELITLSLADGDRERRLMAVPASGGPLVVSDILHYQTIAWWTSQSDRDEFCIVPDTLTRLVALPGVYAAIDRAGRDRGPVVADYSRYVIPSMADFRDRRYVPLQPTLACRVTLDVGEGGSSRVTGVEHVRAGLHARLARAGITRPVRADAVPLLQRYPCRAEIDRLAFWIDREDAPPHDRTTADRVRRVAGAGSWSSLLACVGDVEQALSGIDLDWRDDHLPPASAPCDVDLALAVAHYDRALDDALRATARPDLDRMVAAFQADNRRACLLAAAAVRRVYFEALTEPHPPS